MIKKILSMVLALTISAAVFTGCSKDEDNNSSKVESSSSSQLETEKKIVEPSLTIDGKKMDTKNFVMCTINGEDIDFNTFRYHYYQMLSTYANTYGITIDQINSTDNGFNLFLTDVVSSIKQGKVFYQLANEENITLSDDDKKEVEKSIDTIKSNYASDKEFENELKANYLTADMYKKLKEDEAIYNKVNEQLLSNEGKYATKKADFKKIVKDTDKYCRVIHVMIPYYSQAELDESTAESYDKLTTSEKAAAKQAAYMTLSEDEQKKAQEKAKKVAEEVLKKAKNGDDFKKLIKEYGWDSNFEENYDGYYFDKNTSGLPKEYVNESFKVKENEIVDKVLSDDSAAYLVVKRVPVEMKYVDTNIDTMIYNYDAANISKMIEERMKKLDVKYCDGWDKLTSESIT